MEPFIYPVQIVLPLARTMRESFGLVPTVPLGVANYIQPVLLTNLPNSPLDVNVVAPDPLVELPLKEKSVFADSNILGSQKTIAGNGSTDFIIANQPHDTSQGKFWVWYLQGSVNINTSALQGAAIPVAWIANSAQSGEQYIHRGAAICLGNLSAAQIDVRIITGPTSLVPSSLKLRVYNPSTGNLIISKVIGRITLSELS